jgi:hypothetical protein
LSNNYAHRFATIVCSEWNIYKKRVDTVHGNHGNRIRYNEILTKFTRILAHDNTPFERWQTNACQREFQIRLATLSASVAIPTVPRSVGIAHGIHRTRTRIDAINDVISVTHANLTHTIVLNLIAELCSLLLIHSINYTIANLVDGLLNVARLTSKVIINAINATLSLTAAITDLSRDIIETTLDIVTEVANTLVDLITDGIDGCVHTAETLTKSLLNVGETGESVGVLRVKTITKTILNAVQLVVDTGSIKTSLNLTEDIIAASVEAAAPSAICEKCEEQKNREGVTAPTAETETTHSAEHSGAPGIPTTPAATICICVTLTYGIAFCEFTHNESSL